MVKIEARVNYLVVESKVRGARSNTKAAFGPQESNLFCKDGNKNNAM